jgi:hypothetical protein
MAKDDEVSGDGNSYTTDYRQLDVRIGRWFSHDLIFKPWESPYASMYNNPLIFIDPLGLEPPDKRNLGYAFKRFARWVKGDSYKHTANKEAWKLQEQGFEVDITIKTNSKGREYADVEGTKTEGYSETIDVKEEGSEIKKQVNLFSTIVTRKQFLDKARWVSRNESKVTLGLRFGGHIKGAFGISADANLGSVDYYSKIKIKEFNSTKPTIIERSGIIVDGTENGLNQLQITHGASTDFVFIGGSVDHTYNLAPMLTNDKISDQNTEYRITAIGLSRITNTNPNYTTRLAKSIGIQFGVGGAIMASGSINRFIGIEYYDK